MESTNEQALERKLHQETRYLHISIPYGEDEGNELITFDDGLATELQCETDFVPPMFNNENRTLEVMVDLAEHKVLGWSEVNLWAILFFITICRWLRRRYGLFRRRCWRSGRIRLGIVTRAAKNGNRHSSGYHHEGYSSKYSHRLHTIVDSCLSGLQIFQRILSQSQHVVLIDVVAWMCALIRRTITILHRELATTITDADECALELSVTLLGLPNIHLAYPPYLAIPCTERIDTVDLGTLNVA